MPRVSIIMATYNCKDTLKKSIDSILLQTYTDWEFIICDDCSSDGSYGVLLEYKNRYSDKFIVLRNEVNSKLAFSLNRCLEIAKGEYIARMDGDDISVPERLQRQVSFLDANPEYAVVGTAMSAFEQDDCKLKNTRYVKEIPSPNDLLNGPCFFHATIMMRKQAYELVGGYTVSDRTMRAQDYDMWFRFFANGLTGYNLQEALYLVREDDAALKRRTIKSRCYEVQTKLIGYHLLNYPWYKYICAFKPIMSALVPIGLMQKYHNYTAKKSNNKG